jgi:hypothetical protein
VQDVILPCILDDPTTNTLASHIMLNHVSIVTALRYAMAPLAWVVNGRVLVARCAFHV